MNILLLKYFRTAWLMRKLIVRKYMRNINDNAVQGRLSENYLTRKFIAWNISDTKYSRFTVFGVTVEEYNIHVHVCINKHSVWWMSKKSLVSLNLLHVYYIQWKLFSDSHFSYNYSPCHYLEGTKDAFCYKFRRLTNGQNYSAMCTNEWP